MQYLRLYESAQALLPGVVAFTSHYPNSFYFKKLTFWYFAAFLFHSLFIHCYNDLCDLSKDRKNPRKTNLTEKNKKILRLLTATFFILTILFFFFLPVRLIFLFSFLILIEVIYCHSKKWTELPIGHLFHFIGGSLFFISGILVFEEKIAMRDYFGMCSYGFLYLSGGLLNETMDLKYDRFYGLKTFAVILGAKKTFYLALASQVLALICFNLFFPHKILLGVCFLAGIFYFKTIQRSRTFLDEQKSIIQFRKYSRLYFGTITIILLTLILFSHV